MTGADALPDDAELILLVRHAETQLNVERRFRGRLDPPLSEEGERQAGCLADAFSADPPVVLVSSPRRRALQTATAMVRTLCTAVSVDRRLDDVDYGEWTGLTLADARQTWPDLVATYLADPASVRFPGGETLGAAQDRAWSLLADLATARPAGTIALITHDAIIRLLVCRALGAPLSAVHHLAVDLASTTGLVLSRSATHVAWLNGSHPGPGMRRGAAPGTSR